MWGAGLSWQVLKPDWLLLHKQWLAPVQLSGPEAMIGCHWINTPSLSFLQAPIFKRKVKMWRTNGKLNALTPKIKFCREVIELSPAFLSVFLSPFYILSAFFAKLLLLWWFVSGHIHKSPEGFILFTFPPIQQSENKACSKIKKQLPRRSRT